MRRNRDNTNRLPWPHWELILQFVVHRAPCMNTSTCFVNGVQGLMEIANEMNGEHQSLPLLLPSRAANIALQTSSSATTQSPSGDAAHSFAGSYPSSAMGMSTKCHRVERGFCTR
jgi:hypothetical protein